MPVVLPPGRASERTKPEATKSEDRATIGNREDRSRCGADCEHHQRKDNVRSSLGQRRRDVRALIFAKIKATNNELQVLPLNETEHLELVKKRDHPWCLTSGAGQYAKSVDASGLLRARDGHPKQRQRRRTPDKGDESLSPHQVPTADSHYVSIPCPGVVIEACGAARTGPLMSMRVNRAIRVTYSAANVRCSRKRQLATKLRARNRHQAAVS